MIKHYIGRKKSQKANPAWIREMISMESEGEVSPAQQPDLKIRADFERGGFCIVANGEPNGTVYAKSQYKRAVIDRTWVLAQLATGEV